MPRRGTLLDAAKMGRLQHDDPDRPKWRWESNPAREGERWSQQDKVLNTTTGKGFEDVPIKEVLFGGAPGGGKTYLLIAMAYIHVLEYGPDAFVGMFRQETPEFRDILRQARQMYVPLGGQWNDRDRVWTFPNGGVVQMTYLRTMEDALGHKGAAYSLLLWDELTGWHDDGPYEFLLTRLRTTNKEIVPQSVASCNPDGPGMWWVRDRWRIMDPDCPPETPFLGELPPETPAHIKPHWRVFIPSLLSDNPHFEGTGYEESLWAIRDPVRRNAYVKGDWSVFVGQAYPEFSEKFHVYEDFPIPHTWPRWAAMDWGTAKPYCVLYFAMDPASGHIYVFRETYGNDVNRKNVGLGLAASVVAKEEWDLRGSIINPQMLAVDGSIFNRTGTDRTIGEEWQEAGWTCERGNRDRRTRGEKIRNVLQTFLPGTGRPMLQIARSCANLIRTIQVLVMDEKKPEEVMDGGEDHPWDTLGYGLLCSIANAFQMIFARQALNTAAGIGPVVADPRNEHYDGMQQWQEGTRRQTERPDHLKEEFDAYVLSRSTGRA